MIYRRFVYKLTFPDGNVYIGSTSNLKARWANDGANYRNTTVWGAIKRFGWDNVKKECIIELKPSAENETVCLKVERELIKAYDGRSYNLLGTEAHDKERTAHLKGSRTKFWTIDGETLSAAEWCERYNMNYATVLKRVNRQGLSLKQALTLPEVPVEYRKRAIEYWESVGAWHQPCDVVQPCEAGFRLTDN